MAKSFSVQLKAFAEKTKGNAHLVAKKVVLEIGTSLVMMSPVGDGTYWINPPPKGYVGGRFRANWQLGIGAIDYTTSEAVDPSGEATVGSLFTTVMGEESAAKVFYFSNSLPYAQRIEDGWSHRQAPQGVVGITVLRFREFLSKAVSEVK